MSLSSLEYQLVRDLVHSRSGIVLDIGKEYLIDARLSALAKRIGTSSISDLLASVRGAGGKLIERDIIDAMTTNETSFFRDMTPFEAVRNVVVPDLLLKRAASRKLNIWCAASSTGQEPYTLAIVIKEHFPQLAGWTINFIASDLSRDVLDRARAGRYSQLEIGRGMPPHLLNKYFVKAGLEWQIKPEVQRLIDFREINLVEKWPMLPTFDLVFIRNVLIYFNDTSRRDILGRMRSILNADGYLFLGGAETTLNLDASYETVPVSKSGCYRLRKKLAMAA